MGITKVTFGSGRLGFSLRGNIITKVFPNTQAEKAGISVGWKIIEVNNKRCSDNHKEIVPAIKRTFDIGKSTTILFEEIPITKLRYSQIPLQLMDITPIKPNPFFNRTPPTSAIKKSFPLCRPEKIEPKSLFVTKCNKEFLNAYEAEKKKLSEEKERTKQRKRIGNEKEIKSFKNTPRKKEEEIEKE